jgi:ABC-type microcin C transport system permease subunit YejB
MSADDLIGLLVILALVGVCVAILTERIARLIEARITFRRRFGQGFKHKRTR